jgi:hypothetical protein
MKLIWRGNYPYPDLDGRGYIDRLNLEIKCVRSYPMPSDKYSVEDLENMGLYGLYEIEDDGVRPCPNCSFSHSPCPRPVEPPQKKYKVTWKTPLGFMGLKPEIFNSWDECQKECEKMDLKWPTVRHWPEEI